MATIDKTKLISVKPKDESRINVRETQDLQYWTRSLRCSREELEEAIQNVGNSPEQVKQYIQRYKKRD